MKTNNSLKTFFFLFASCFVCTMASANKLVLGDKFKISRVSDINFLANNNKLVAGASLDGKYVNCTIENVNADLRYNRQVESSLFKNTSVTRINERKILNPKGVELGQNPVYLYLFEISANVEMSVSTWADGSGSFKSEGRLNIYCDSSAENNDWLEIISELLPQIEITR